MFDSISNNSLSLNGATFASPRNPVSYTPKILKSKFAEACCKIWDEFSDEYGPGWQSAYLDIAVRDDEGDNKIVFDYLKHVIQYFSPKWHELYYALPENIPKFLDELIHQNLSYFQWTFMRIEYMHIDPVKKIIPVQFIINEYISDAHPEVLGILSKPTPDISISVMLNNVINELYDSIIIDTIAHIADNGYTLDKPLVDVITNKDYSVVLETVRFNLDTIDELLK